MVDIALFPIPGSVSFPGMVVPLHVFEPRYRKMIQHCVDHQMLLGVAHTDRVISSPPPRDNLEEALRNNAATYKPCSIFSAGSCSIVETLADGRLLIEIAITGRYRTIEKLQTLPFEIHRCEAYHDQVLADAALQEAELLKEKIVHRLSALFADDNEVQELLNSDAITAATATDFSFEIFQLIRLAPKQLQAILESTSPVERLTIVLEQLNQST